MSVNGVAINIGQHWRMDNGHVVLITQRATHPTEYPWTAVSNYGKHYSVSEAGIVKHWDVLLTELISPIPYQIRIGDRFTIHGKERVAVNKFDGDEFPWLLDDGSRWSADYLIPRQVTGTPGPLQAADDSHTKASNPKEALGDKKTPLWLCSPIAEGHWSAAQAAGLVKYGAWNWRAAGVKTSTYLSAIRRHQARYANGERLDPVDGTHHLGNIMACCAILLEAEFIGKLNDDRGPAVDLQPLYDEIEGMVAKLKVQYADKAPKHWTIHDELPS